MTLTLQVPPELESRLREQAAREGVDAGTIIVRALERALPASSPPSPQALSARETELLGKINIGLSQDEWRRYRDLIAKRQQETLTPPEYQELIATGERIEMLNAQRMKQVIELSKLRNVPLMDLMDQLGIGNGRDMDRGLRGG
jgi:hypothetical protein